MAAKEPFPGVPWVHFSDPAAAGLDTLAQRHGWHELDIEDCRHGGQVAKVTHHAQYTFIVIKTIEYRRESHQVSFHDFDLFVMSSQLVTVAEGSTGVVRRTEARLPQEPEFHHPPGLAYLLIDQAVDEYLPVLDEVGDMIEQVEDQVLENPSPEVLQQIFHLKRLLIEFRRNTTAMREVLNHLMRDVGMGAHRPFAEQRRHDDESPALRSEQASYLFPYYRDVYDHVVRALDFIETYRDLVSGAMDIYLSAIANRTNEVMKRLTVYGTISIPVLAITGFYGMNVPLPAQTWPHMGVWLLVLMTGTILLLLLLFWKKGWM